MNKNTYEFPPVTLLRSSMSKGEVAPSNESSPHLFLLREMIENVGFQEALSPTAFCLGKSEDGQYVYDDISAMSHTLIGGACGMGKGALLHDILVSILYKARPDKVKLVLFDPTRVEFASYHDIPHLLFPIIHDTKEMMEKLKWLNDEMERRYERFVNIDCKNIAEYNMVVMGCILVSPLPKIIVVLDNFDDLMRDNKKETVALVENLLRKSRAAGIHLIICPRHPAKDILPAEIKCDLPSRIVFRTITKEDSLAIIDDSGAEALRGRGDMLYRPIGKTQLVRLQCPVVLADEIDAVTEYIRSHN